MLINKACIAMYGFVISFLLDKHFSFGFFVFVFVFFFLILFLQDRVSL